MISNAFIFPVVLFFYPETACRSLEEMDRIFRKTKSIFQVVKVANEEPHMYGPRGELLRTLDDEEDDAVRRTSVLNHSIKDADKDSDDVASTEKI